MPENYNLNLIKGSSVINHNIRALLGISCDEYVVLAFLYEHSVNSIVELPRRIDFWRKLGTERPEPILTSLVANKMILHDRGKITINKKWALHHNDEEGFEALWNIFEKKGNKATAKKRYPSVIKIADKDHLFRRARVYMKSVAESERKFRKGLDVWLNPEKLHWEDVYDNEAKASKPKFKS